jgi:hypothetical protein
MTPPCIFTIISPFEEGVVLYLYKLLKILFYARMICIKFDWNWPASSGEDV